MADVSRLELMCDIADEVLHGKLRLDNRSTTMPKFPLPELIREMDEIIGAFAHAWAFTIEYRNVGELAAFSDDKKRRLERLEAIREVLIERARAEGVYMSPPTEEAP